MIVDSNRLESDGAYREDMRHRFLTDHFFACDVLGFKKFHSVLHKEAVELYFPKNPLLPIENQHPKKNRLHLDPRFTFKTTLGRVDKVMHIAAHPQIVTILTNSATQPLAKAISKSIGRFFWKPKGQTATDFQRMFPELVIETEPFKGSDEWNAPGHTMSTDLDSTLAFTSPQTVQSGWHPWILNVDDMVETRNSGIRASSESRQGVIDTYDTNKNTLVPGGYIYLIGTRYHPFDLYGVRIADMDPDEWKVLIRCSVILKDKHARLVPGEFPAEKDCTVVFTGLPGMDYKSMRTKFYENYEVFMCQQQNDPQGGNISIFDEKLYKSCEIDSDRIPVYGEKFLCWRMPYAGKKEMTRAEGVAAQIVDNKVVVIDGYQGNWIPSKLAEKMVQSYKEHDADGLMIMQTPGSEYMAAHIRNEAARRNVSVRIQWIHWEESDHMRHAEIQQIQPLMNVGRLLFSTAMSKAPECRKQFVHYGLVEETGIIECVTKLADRIPLTRMRAHLEDEELEWRRRGRDNALINSFLDQQNMIGVDEQVQQKAVAHARAASKATTYRMPTLPGGLDG